MRNASTRAVISSVIVLMSVAPCAADGAIFLGRQGSSSTASVYGYEVSMTSVAAAENEAKRYCQSRGPDCEPFVVFGGFCFVIFDAQFADGSGRILINPKPVPREHLFDLDRERPTRQKLLDAALKPALQAVLDEAEREQNAKCASSGGRCVRKARDCDVTTRGGRGSWSESRRPQQPQEPMQSQQPQQPISPASSRPTPTEACQQFPKLCP